VMQVKERLSGGDFNIADKIIFPGIKKSEGICFFHDVILPLNVDIFYHSIKKSLPDFSPETDAGSLFFSYLFKYLLK